MSTARDAMTATLIRGRQVLAGLFCLVLLGGCVTQSTGGLPDPGTTEERVQAQLQLARGYIETGKNDQARRPLNKALRIDPKSVEAHVLLALIYEMEGENVLAEKHFKQALGYDPRNSQALNNYGSFLYARGRYSEAVDRFRVLVKDTNYRARPQAYENLGFAELRAGQTAAAKDSFSRALQLNPTQPRSSLELAQIHYDNRDLLAAQENYDAFRTQSRQTARSLCLGMKLAHRSGNTDQLASYSLALKNLFPDSVEARECEVGG
ncbi:MAG: type IV pilus biogenesis/stability protein PilW [Pseudomonadales bacterium]